jgi:hypothetical protein
VCFEKCHSEPVLSHSCMSISARTLKPLKLTFSSKTKLENVETIVY